MRFDSELRFNGRLRLGGGSFVGGNGFDNGLVQGSAVDGEKSRELAAFDLKKCSYVELLKKIRLD